MFDTNDFDETLPAPWEWDVKRLAASVIIAGRANGFSAAANRAAAMAAVRSYREWMARYAGMRLIDVWYSRITDVRHPRRGRARVRGRPELDARQAQAAGGDVRQGARPRRAQGGRAS